MICSIEILLNCLLILFIMNKLDKIAGFLKEMEQLKLVERCFDLSNSSRKENCAEHSWHMCLMLMALEKDIPGVDFLKVYKMIILHDLVEIHEGDVYFTDDETRKGKSEREKEAASKIFNALPDDLNQEFLALWNEFEERKTKEAKLAQALDKIQAVLQGLVEDGKSWKEWKTTHENIFSYKQEYIDSHDATKALADRLYEEVKKINLNSD